MVVLTAGRDMCPSIAQLTFWCWLAPPISLWRCTDWVGLFSLRELQGQLLRLQDFYHWQNIGLRSTWLFFVLSFQTILLRSSPCVLFCKFCTFFDSVLLTQAGKRWDFHKFPLFNRFERAREGVCVYEKERMSHITLVVLIHDRQKSKKGGIHCCLLYQLLVWSHLTYSLELYFWLSIFIFFLMAYSLTLLVGSPFMCVHKNKQKKKMSVEIIRNFQV